MASTLFRLRPSSDPEQVIAAVAQVLGLRPGGTQPLLESLQAYFSDRQLLLVLDNFEQVLGAAPRVGGLLAACPRLKALVTSRAPLHLYGEHLFPVPPLALPDPMHLTQPQTDPVTSLAQFAAVGLFCQRAMAAQPDFTLTPTNAAVVAEICIRLDGVPLALELAAARVKLFTPSALLIRLKQRLILLTGGPHDAPARQRTLRDEIAWSYDLLAAAEQTLFRRLAVFAGGFTLEAAAAVGNADGDLGITVLDGVAALVDQSLLVRVEPGSHESSAEPRFGMLETLAEYGLERLAAGGEEEAVRRRHAAYFLALAESAALGLLGAGQSTVLVQLEREYANLRAALAWSQGEDTGRDPGTDIKTETALRLASTLQNFWLITGFWSEGRRWLDGALARTSAAERTPIRAATLIAAGELAVMQGDEPAARRQIEEGLAIARERDAQYLVCFALTALGFLADGQHDYPLVISLMEQALAIARTIDNKTQIAGLLIFLGTAARDQFDYPRALGLYGEALAMFQAAGDAWNIADALVFLGQLAQLQGDLARAWALFKESLTGWLALGTLRWKGTAICLEHMADICVVRLQHTKAAQLYGAAEALGEFLQGARRPPPGISAANRLAALGAVPDQAAFVAAWAKGRALSPEQAAAYALALPEPSPSAPSSMLPALPPIPPASAHAR